MHISLSVIIFISLFIFFIKCQLLNCPGFSPCPTEVNFSQQNLMWTAGYEFKCVYIFSQEPSLISSEDLISNDFPWPDMAMGFAHWLSKTHRHGLNIWSTDAILDLERGGYSSTNTWTNQRVLHFLEIVQRAAWVSGSEEHRGRICLKFQESQHSEESLENSCFTGQIWFLYWWNGNGLHSLGAI